jgi:BioD-like phosphotransacetylase family protein
VDEDAAFIAEQVGAAAAPEELCPVLLDEQLMAQACAGILLPLAEKVSAAYEHIAKGKDIVVAGGLGDLARGGLINLAAPAVAELLAAKALIITRYEGDSSVEDLLAAPAVLGDRLLGVIFNYATPANYEHLKKSVAPCLEKRGIPVFGVVPQDDTLGAISLAELAQGLGAKVLCGEKGLQALAKNILVGAMGPQSAAKYLQQVDDKIVVTGGDRPDIQLAALQTSTRGLLLTGNLHPSNVILKRAQELGIPVLLAGKDTFTVVEEVDRLKGKLRLRGEVKVARAKELYAQEVDLARLFGAVGI